MTIRTFFKTGEDLYQEKDTIELEFRPIVGDVLHHEGNRYSIIGVEYGTAVNGKQTISVYLTVAPAKIG